jgi:predicted ribosome quality control (RQC) complex YloA/Tae2 family protein
MSLDPARPARLQLEAMFRRAKRMREGVTIARARLADAERAREALARAKEAVQTADGVDALVSIENAARAAAPRDFKLEGSARGPTLPSRGPRRGIVSAPPYRTFRSGEARILVGRGAAHNDELTLHVARPHDLWLHAKGRGGAHVIVPLDKGAVVNGPVLVDAAHLAAHFSDARGETTVEIEYTPRRYLRKPRASAAGFVVVTREKVLVLRMEPDRIARLLATEEA